MLNSLTLVFIILINTLIGFLIKKSNPGRSQNQQFFILSIALTLWMLSVLGIMNAHAEAVANQLIRIATVLSMLLPFQLGMLLQSILQPTISTAELYKKKRWSALAGICVTILCFTNFFMHGVIMPSPENPGVSVPEAQYGAGFAIFALYFFTILISNIVSAIKGLKTEVGLVRLELQYVLLGAGIMLVTGSFISLIIPLLTKSTQVQQYGPVSVIAMNAVIAYGIATRHILEVSTFIRKIVAYTLQTAFLISIYLITHFVVTLLLNDLTSHANFISQLLAAVVVAFSMAPMHGRLQKVANKLVISHAMDVPTVMKKAGNIFQSVTTKAALQKQFTTLLVDALKAEDVKILLKVGKYYTCAGSRMEMSSNLLNMLHTTRDPISIDQLSRSRQTTKVKEVAQALEDMNASLITGIFSKSELNGLILFSTRTGGRIYDKAEQDALQILCNQFAVALENAQLYTKVQDSKIQNEIMLDQLASGVVVASPEREITLFNHEAQKTTGIGEENAIGQNIAILPREIYLALEVTLENQNGVRNIDASLHSEEGSEESLKNIRMGSAFLFGHDGKPMGAMLVFTDVTELKALEEQVRRSDQLSSVGTLAAGMAHEIKNPLVTIKTFTQLLPQRYGDEDFRKDFSSLVAHEVERIDGIVNELLSFSKPAQPHLVPMNFQETLEQTLKLVHEQLAQKNIELKNKYKAQKTDILGDAKLLSQALVNLNLNAIDAIGSDGKLTVGTTNCSYRFANGDSPDRATTRKCIRLQISDNGKGIERENLQKIFDPFFTSKSEGTGMGLSVAHGIISEHHGVIEVDSEVGRGTTFFIYIPLLEEGVVE